jgi:hypothetical protein
MGGNATIWVKVVEAADLSRPALLKQGWTAWRKETPTSVRSSAEQASATPTSLGRTWSFASMRRL